MKPTISASRHSERPTPPIIDNFAYKFATPDGTIVFSSDTIYNPALAKFAEGADVLVHEALFAPYIDRLVARVRNGATLASICSRATPPRRTSAGSRPPPA